MSRARYPSRATRGHVPGARPVPIPVRRDVSRTPCGLPGTSGRAPANQRNRGSDPYDDKRTEGGRPAAETSEYFEKRSLAQGSVSWVMLMGLGVAYAISGDFSGWNYGIAQGGWVGMLIAFLVMGAMYLFMSFGLAEMSWRHAHGGCGLRFRPPRDGKRWAAPSRVLPSC